MITTTAFSLLAYSMTAVLGALLLLALSLRWRRLQRPALRLLAVFGVFTIASAYIWLKVGPEADYWLHAAEQPRLHLAPPFEREA